MAFIFQVTPMGQLSKSPNQGLKREKNFQEANFVIKISNINRGSTDPQLILTRQHN
jgi:hypothetical protein